MIKLDIISDVMCPWCIIGFRRLEKAIEEMGIQDQVEIEWQPFELNPNMPSEGEEIQEHITRKYGSTLEQSKKSQELLTSLGAEVGFTFDYFDGMHIVNSREAHVLLQYAKEQGKQTELNIRFMEAFFSERKDVSKREILLQEVEKIGLDKNEALNRLNDKNALDEIQNIENYWQSLGVSSVPTIVFNRTSALNGAQPVEVYKQVLTEILEQK
ncbi:DsbA family oxidoreductase [uncultured Flavobacterium sp.]|uniref:DsbA family oxidoreductase n=1 Tax=uncultured Flavobacterium sp. TaxID=165435 RepID=UPI0030EE3434|tara:strand:+ start:53526 stop:54164 length:639 start_codon:yes stop_codon:yes gene_type:complete